MQSSKLQFKMQSHKESRAVSYDGLCGSVSFAFHIAILPFDFCLLNSVGVHAPVLEAE
jgi:hypothetical protein